MPRFRIGAARPEDWPALVAWMAAEGWRLPEWEPQVLAAGPARTLVLREPQGATGCVSVMAYPRSGWIGNLLVPPAARRQGRGRRLLRQALAQLEPRPTLWLTASAQGAPLYRQHGFVEVGGIVRWTRAGAGGAAVSAPVASPASFLAADAACWGDDRTALLAPLAARGRVLASGASLALLQEGQRRRVLGPWYCPNLCPREGRDILATALDATPADAELVIDLSDTSPLAGLLQAIGFRRAGDNRLMVRAATSRQLPPHLALASLGSLG